MALTVTQVLTEYRFGDPDAPALEFAASGNTGDVIWEASSGFINPPVGLNAILSALNRTEMVTVTAHDDLNTVVKTVQVWGTLPVQPKWGIESDSDPPIVRWPMVYEKRDQQEYWSILQFFKWHGKALIETSEAEDGTVTFRVVKGKAFYVDDISTGEIAKVYFDSAIRRSFQAADYVDYSFQLAGFAHEIPEFPVTGPFKPAYSSDEYGEGEYGEGGL